MMAAVGGATVEGETLLREVEERYASCIGELLGRAAEVDRAADDDEDSDGDDD